MSEDAEGTERVTMVWPKDLKGRVRDKVGPRGLTEFVLEATEIHLKGSDALHEAQRETNEVKHLTQLLADRLVMGGSAADRLEALMEIEFPSWVDTTGWPSEYAKLVKPDLYEPVQTHVEPEAKVEVTPTADVAPKPEPARVAPKSAPRAEEPASLPHDVHTPDLKGRDDLFARVMAKTGGKLDSIKDQLKPASEIPQPPPKAQKDLCGKCGDELVDGECWSCEM